MLSGVVSAEPEAVEKGIEVAAVAAPLQSKTGEG